VWWTRDIARAHALHAATTRALRVACLPHAGLPRLPHYRATRMPHHSSLERQSTVGVVAAPHQRLLHCSTRTTPPLHTTPTPPPTLPTCHTTRRVTCRPPPHWRCASARPPPAATPNAARLLPRAGLPSSRRVAWTLALQRRRAKGGIRRTRTRYRLNGMLPHPRLSPSAFVRLDSLRRTASTGLRFSWFTVHLIPVCSIVVREWVSIPFAALSLSLVDMAWLTTRDNGGRGGKNKRLVDVAHLWNWIINPSLPARRSVPYVYTGREHRYSAAERARRYNDIHAPPMTATKTYALHTA